LKAGALEPAPSVCVVDVSFISLRTVAPHLRAISAADAVFVLLIKPQFEAGRRRVDRGGIVRDAEVRTEVVREVVEGLAAQKLGVTDVIESPLRGADGNVEFLAYARSA
jgi:23S rRNA (cytidine1920-2'-O)/16S rRNA (cytidine1409-2'-O)-methyltransferase